MGFSHACEKKISALPRLQSVVNGFNVRLQLNLEERFLQYFQQTKKPRHVGTWVWKLRKSQTGNTMAFCTSDLSSECRGQHNNDTHHNRLYEMKCQVNDGRTDGWIVGSPTSSIAWILLIIHISSFESIKRSLSFYKLNDSHYNVLCHEQMQLPCRVRSLSFIALTAPCSNSCFPVSL